MQLITTDIGQVKVGNVILPGTFESLEIQAAVKMDEVEIKGKKEKVTQAVGYDNARVRLNLILLPAEDGGDCTAQVQTIQAVFRRSPDQEKPGVYRIVNKHVQARGINEVIFSDYRTFEDNRSDKCLVICEFVEHVPIKVTVAPKKSAAPAPKRPAPKKTPPPGFGDLRKAELTKPPGMGDLRRLEMQDKKAATPAKDTREPSLGKKILAWLRGSDNLG